MAFSLKLLPSIGKPLSDGFTLPDLGFPNFPTSNGIRFGGSLSHQIKKNKIELSFQMVKAMSKVDETSSSNEVNAQSDLDCTTYGFTNGNGTIRKQMSTVEKSTNILWHECSVNKNDREQLLQQKGCVIWITGLSGSGMLI
ncbi:Adenylyl-sulfate kinase 1 chloroplastic [Bienertia sinuspersici]